MISFEEATERELLRKSELLKVLGHPERLAILLLVYEEEMCVKDLMEALQISQPKVSQHVGLMKELGILSFRKKGTKVIYRLSNSVVKEILDILFE
jgi:ArsR family transcriptional regulator